MKFNILLLLLLIVTSGLTNAQSLECFNCGKRIDKNYITVEGHTYHPEHFLCSICNQPINGSFTKDNDNYYHVNCFRDNKLEKCAVCGNPIEGEYYIDAFGNKYHAKHESEFSKCSNCGRLICPSLTNGGKSYGDSRNTCNICFKDAVFSDNDYKRLMKIVLAELNSWGLDLEGDNINIQAVNLYELRRQTGAKANQKDLQGFCKSEKITNFIGSVSFNHTIYVLNGMPSITTEQVIAHELMHAWIFVNTEKEPYASENEGICNYLSYLYLVSSGDTNAAFNIRKLEENPDPVYGEGFRNIRNRFKDKPLSKLLEYLKN